MASPAAINGQGEYTPMILRRVIKHFRNQEWTAIFLDFLIVVVGVYVGVWIGNYQEQITLHAKQAQVVETLRLDMQSVNDINTGFAKSISQGFDAWAQEKAKGKMPPPFYYRVPGSDMPPQNTWKSLPPDQMTDLFAPDLLFDLGFYYSELDGVARKYLRYVIFVEDELLPGMEEESGYFYREDGQHLKPKFKANMDRLHDWVDENQRLRTWSACLVVRLETPMKPGKSCIPDLTMPVVEAH
jgi:hypothetical protein